MGKNCTQYFDHKPQLSIWISMKMMQPTTNEISCAQLSVDCTRCDNHNFVKTCFTLAKYHGISFGCTWHFATSNCLLPLKIVKVLWWRTCITVIDWSHYAAADSWRIISLPCQWQQRYISQDSVCQFKRTVITHLAGALNVHERKSAFILTILQSKRNTHIQREKKIA